MSRAPSPHRPPHPPVGPDDDALTEGLVQLLLADWARRHATEAAAGSDVVTGDVVNEDAAS